MFVLVLIIQGWISYFFKGWGWVDLFGGSSEKLLQRWHWGLSGTSTQKVDKEFPLAI